MYCSWILGLSYLYVGASTLSHFEPYSGATIFSCMCCFQDGNLKNALNETQRKARTKGSDAYVTTLAQVERLRALEGLQPGVG